MRVCCDCKEPLTLENWTPGNRVKNHGICKFCQRKRAEAWREKNKGREIKRRKNYDYLTCDAGDLFSKEKTHVCTNCGAKINVNEFMLTKGKCFPCVVKEKRLKLGHDNEGWKTHYKYSSKDNVRYQKTLEKFKEVLSSGGVLKIDGGHIYLADQKARENIDGIVIDRSIEESFFVNKRAIYRAIKIKTTNYKRGVPLVWQNICDNLKD